MDNIEDASVYIRMIQYSLDQKKPQFGRCCVPTELAQQIRTAFVDGYAVRIGPARTKGHVWVTVWQRQ